MTTTWSRRIRLAQVIDRAPAFLVPRLGNAVTSANLMRDPDYVPVSSAFLMRGRHNRQDFEQSDGLADLREHRLRDDLAQVPDKVEDLREHRLRDNLAQVTDKGTGAGGSKPWKSVPGRTIARMNAMKTSW